jgi:hypothetical protein
MRFVVEVVIIIGGGLPGFLGASCSDDVFSTLVVFLSMSVVLRGAKKLRVNFTFGGILTAANVGTDLVDSSLSAKYYERCLLCLFTSWKSLSWAVDSTEVLFTAPLCPACALTFRMTYSSFIVTVYMP